MKTYMSVVVNSGSSTSLCSLSLDSLDAERGGPKKKIFYLKLTTKILGIACGVIGTCV